MKVKLFCTTLIFLATISMARSQTKEHVDRIKHIQDSMMNLPQLKEMMNQLEDLKASQVTMEKKIENIEKKTSGADAWYWNNDWYSTRASVNNKFENWDSSLLTIVVAFKQEAQDIFRYLKVGTIQPDGSIVIHLPDSVKTQLSFEKEIGPQGLFHDINNEASKKIMNKGIGFLAKPDFLIMHDEKIIGSLTMGNSVRVTHNLRTQGSLNAGDDGYLLYWAWADDSCSLEVNEDWQGKVQLDGTNEMNVKTNVRYHQQFKKGWNLVKAEVTGRYKFVHERGLDVSWFKKHDHAVLETMPDEAVYFYRRNKY